MTTKFNPWEKLEPCLLPARKGEDSNGIADRRINPAAFKASKDFPGVTPAHFSRNILSEMVVLAHLAAQFRFTDPVKLQKCEDALQNFKTKRPNWEDFV